MNSAQSVRRMAISLVRISLLFCALLGCKKPAVDPTAPTVAVGEIDQSSESGPVKASVKLSPKKPQLGDSLTLTLTVTAQPGVQVEMPPFGEALGRFAITSFTPRSDTLADGSTQHSQRYVLEAPMSGRQRIPSLRIEFSDPRSAAASSAAASQDAGVDPGGDTVHELLTDEIAVDIASTLTDGKDNELRGLREPLPEGPGPGELVGYAAGPAVVLLGLAAAWWLRRVRRRAALQTRISAYEQARQRLTDLERRGWPTQQEVDSWYVELSDIVRRYIEDRYGVRAPELTTEEFLREARGQLALQPAQRELLEAFLQTCDRVKFAGYLPQTTESQQAFAEAQRFLDDTRLQPSARPDAPAGGSP